MMTAERQFTPGILLVDEIRSSWPLMTAEGALEQLTMPTLLSDWPSTPEDPLVSLAPIIDTQQVLPRDYYQLGSLSHIAL